ncbi:hypothetical protein ACFL6U_22110, partial [Planctomycetota bacterium]
MTRKLCVVLCMALFATTAMAVYVQGDDGIAVMEAELYDGIAPAESGEFEWVFDTEFAGYSQDGYMRALPGGTNVMSDYTRCPRLDYDVKITQPGTLYFWARVLAPTSAMNSIHLGDSGAVTADRINIPEIAVWIWKNEANDGSRAAVEVSAPGVVTVNCWMRESGVCVDKLLLTSDPAYVPEGEGPADTRESENAKNPDPADASVDVPRDTILSWSPGDYAASHDVYFGTDFNNVNDATTASPEFNGNQADTTYPLGRLEFEETLFWRIDEVNDAHPDKLWKGDVWSFEVEPVGILVEQLTATASSQNSADEPPDNT